MRGFKYFLLILALLISADMWAQYNPINPVEPGVYYTLTLQATPSGAGSFNIGTSTTYSEGTTINLRAYTNSNFSFVGWKLDDEVISTSSYFTYTMPARNVKLVAHYEYNPGNPAEPSESSSYSTLFLEASPSNGGYFNIASGNRYEVGSTVSLRAYNNSNFSFKNWTENGEVVSTSSSFQYVMKEGNPTLVANFTYNPGNPSEPSEPHLYHKLFLKSNPETGGYFNMESGNEYQEGSNVSLRAYSNQRYVFNNWSIGDSIISSNYVLNYLMPNSDITLTANYTYSPSLPDEPITPTTDQTHIYGMTENGVRGQTIYYPVFLANSYSVRGMAIDVQFPQGFSVQPDNVSLSGRVTEQELGVMNLGSNLYRFTLIGDEAFYDNNGKLFEVPISIPDDAEMGQSFPVVLTHGVVYGTDGSQSAVSVRSGNIFVEKVSEDGLYAKFSYDKLLGRVKFTNLSSDKAVSFFWDFGDGTTSTEKDPLHVYSDAGYYEVKLTITGQTDTDVAEQTVLINDKSNWRVDGTLYLAEEEQGVRYFTSFEQLLAFLETSTLSGNLRIAVQSSCSFSLPLSSDNIERLKQLREELEANNYFLSLVKYGEGNVPVVSFGEESEAFNREFVDFFMTFGQRINCKNVKVRLWTYTINIAIIRELSRQTIHSGEKTKSIDLLGFSSDLSFQWELVSMPIEGVSGFLTSGSQAIPSMTIINESDGTCQLVYHVVAKRGDETFCEFDVSIFVTPSLVGLFTNLSPGNGSISESSTVTLSWNNIKNAVYDVYLWDAKNIRPATPIASDIEVLRYTSQGFCQTGHTYKWQVVAHNEWQTLASDTMFFSVRSLPNLRIISLDCSEAIAGMPMTVKWKVRNDGTGPTDGSEWKDYIWLVPNISVGTSMIGTRLLATCDNVAALKPGETYEGVTNVTLDKRIYGNYDLLVTSNMYGATDIDYSRTNGVPPIPYMPEAGSYGFLTAKGNSSYVTMEEEGEHDGISDNFFYKRIDIQVPPLPDIQVPQVVAVVDTTGLGGTDSSSQVSMNQFFSGKKVLVTATIANMGGADIDSASIQNILYISNKPDLSSTHLELARQTIDVSLKAGKMMTTTFVAVIPIRWSGEAYFVVKADTYDAVYEFGNTENNIGSSSLFDVILSPGPDFVPSELNVPNHILAGTSFKFGYTMKNRGVGLPAGFQRFYSKHDPLNNPSWKDRIYLSTKSTGLDASAVCIAEIQRGRKFIPVYEYYSIIIHIFVDEDGNEYAYKEIIRPEFSISSVMSVIMGNISLIGWHDGFKLHTNAGIGISIENDEVRIGHGNVCEFLGYMYLGDYYGDEFPLKINQLPEGTYYMYTVVDEDDDVYEFNGEDNNVIMSGPIKYGVPDFSVELLSLSKDTLSSGSKIAAKWKVKNIGLIGIRDFRIKNTFFASSKADGSSPIVLGTTYKTVSIPGEGEEIMYEMITIPQNRNLVGPYYVFVKAVIEGIHETVTSNNTSAGIVKQFEYVEEPSEIINGTNLKVKATPIQISEAMPNDEIPISYTISNTGTYVIDRNVSQEVFISKRTTFDDTAHPLSVSGTLPDVAGLNPGETVTADLSTVIPSDIMGGQNYIHVVINRDKVFAEKKTDDNYAHSAIYIKDNLPDLAISDVIVPDTVVTSEKTTIKWTLTNNGTWEAGKVACNIYLSTDAAYSNDDKLLAKAQSGYIAKNTSKIIECPIELEDDVVGTHYLIILVNPDGAVEEMGNENKIASQAFISKQALLPDLTISDLSYEGLWCGGQKVTVKALVKNVGEHETRKDKWTDVFYLSEGYTLDVNKAIQLGSKAHVGKLDKDGFYKVFIEANIPKGLKGNYVLFGVTDATNSIIEKNENNNQVKSLIYMADKYDRPVDLVVNKVIAPSRIVAGESFTISYTLANEGQFVAEGQLRDVLYLSKDNKWDKYDAMVGVVTGDVELAPGNELVRNVTGRITNMFEGDYYLIVRTNSNQNIAETNYENNVMVQPSVSSIEFTSFALDTPITVNTSGLYKLPLHQGISGKTVGLYLNTEKNTSTGLYVAFEQVPSTAHYDKSSSDLENTEQEILISNVKEGTYYILAQDNAAVSRSLNEFVIDGEQEFEETTMTLTAREIPFGATTISINEGGTNGWLSTEIHGALLDSIMDFRLARDGEIIPAESVTFHDQTSSKATFNLNDATTGSYDVVSELPDGTQVTMPNGFKVVPGTNVALGVNLSAPTTTRVDGYAPVHISWVNGGNTDIVIRELLLVITGGYVSKTIEGFDEKLTMLHIRPDVGQDNRGFVTIPPGMKKTVNYYFKQTSNQTNLKLYIIK